MAEMKKHTYSTNGAAAYDIYSMPGYESSSAARKLPQPYELPEERPAHIREKKVKARLAVTPFTIIGVAAVAMLLLMVVYGYVRLYEAKSVSGELDNTLSAATEENTRLQAEYDGLVDYDMIDAYALAHGMQQPTSAQTVYVSVQKADVAQIENTKEPGIFSKAWSAFRESFTGLMEYIA